MAGLSSHEAEARLARDGPNALPVQPSESWAHRFARQFAGPLVRILIAALVFDVALWWYEGRAGWPVEATAIAIILLFNALLGMYQEQRSEAALARLDELAAAQAWVLRDGALTRVPARHLVAGDRVRIDAGDRVPADGVLDGPGDVLVDESMLTGESLPVGRTRGDEIFSGTLIVRGQTFFDVTRTGAASAMGRLATTLTGIQARQTPLERRVDVLGGRIARWVIVLAAFVGLLGLAVEGLSRGPEVVLFAVALAVAAVPEGLPAVLTVALALGVERMARHRAVVRRLSAVEALGSVTVIATDKTGTLTEGRMDVRLVDAVDRRHAMAAVVLANQADLNTGAGDPLDLGLLRHATAQGIHIADLRRRHPVVSERPFDSAWSFARVTVREGEALVTYVKGAPEVVLARCALSAADRDSWSEKARAYAESGYRVVGLAWAAGETEEDLSFAGLVLFWDPPRAEVPDAVRRAQAAGIRVLMITGDHPSTGLAIAQRIGIPGVRVLTGADLDEYDDDALRDALAEVNVFARVRPEQKLRIVEALQRSGQIVAMTGDGINDAAALKQADVGVAMGVRGSDVTREVADLVLLDDNFATIVGAVEEGRGIYENIQKFLRFLFSTNLSEVLLVAIGAVLAFAIGLRDANGSAMLPLTAVQILWINLLTDGLPALALAFDRTPALMRERPRAADSPLLDAPSMRFVVIVGAMKAALGLAVLGIVPRLGYDLETARAAAFHLMALGQLLLTFPSRHAATRPMPNRYLRAAVGGGFLIQAAVATLPQASRLLGDVTIPAPLWAIVLAGAAAAWAAAEWTARWLWRRPAAGRAENPARA